MTAPAPPGWYADPDGAPGTLRWWNGSSWSDVTTPAGPGVAVGSMPGQPDRWESGEELITGDAPASLGGRTRWVLGLGAALLVVVVVVAALAGGSGADAPPVSAAPSTDAAPSAPPQFPPGTIRIVDENAGISYPHLGDGWFEYDLAPKDETVGTAGQYFVTQDDPPEGGLYLAECTSGPVADGFGWTGPASLRDTALPDRAERSGPTYYPAPNEQRVLRDEPRDGRRPHDAHLFEFELFVDGPATTRPASGPRCSSWTSARPVPPRCSSWSIPNTHAELYGVIDRIVEDVDVLD